jgi:hypothetical protein
VKFRPSWESICNTTIGISLGGVVVHLAIGSVWAAATHAFIGMLAAMVRGHLR